jgi:hypothetical protein
MVRSARRSSGRAARAGPAELADRRKRGAISRTSPARVRMRPRRATNALRTNRARAVLSMKRPAAAGQALQFPPFSDTFDAPDPRRSETKVGFCDLTEGERIALIRQAVADRRTLIERWAALEMPEASNWSERAARAGALLADCASVADLGCGPMQLKSYLKPGTRYVPVDVIARDPSTIVVDLNEQLLPALDVEGWAAVGLLEHLFDVPGLLRQLSGVVVTSYNPTDGGGPKPRSPAWVNHYDTAELEAVFRDGGWSIVERETLGSQRIWKLRR